MKVEAVVFHQDVLRMSTQWIERFSNEKVQSRFELKISSISVDNMLGKISQS